VGRGGRPGEITLAHRGLLFLDELPEFNRLVREALREPLEEGELVMSRGAGCIKWPARFQLVAAMNPCPCGQSLRGSEHCRCTPAQVRAYFARISGPLLDRIDLVVEVPPWRPPAPGEPQEGSEPVRQRIAAARSLLARGDPERLSPADALWLDEELARAGVSFRVRQKLRRTARTLAALEGRLGIERGDLLEAMEFCLDLRRRLESRSACE